MIWFWLIVVFILGLAVGSFLNALIFRLHLGESVAKGRSKCPKCQHELNTWDLIPVLSFIWLRGRCRYCQTTISWQYPIVELVTAGLFALVYNYLISSAQPSLSGVPPGAGAGTVAGILYLIFLWFIASVLIVVFVYDLKHGLILDKVVYPALAVTFIAVLFLPQFDFWPALIGSGVVGGFFLILVLLSRETWMGWGDAKLGFLLGLAVGWPLCLPLLFIAFVGGSVVALLLMAIKLKGLKDTVPFGTMLTAAAIITLFVGPKIIEWYMGLLG